MNSGTVQPTWRWKWMAVLSPAEQLHGPVEAQHVGEAPLPFKLALRQLVEILQLFSEVGWTDALRLLYDLPDLLR